MDEIKKVTVFYSWQSDLPREANQNAIRKALRIAANKLEDTDTELHIILDEATRNTAGSPNIPMTIFQKISTSDIFICDLTTINSTSDKRKVPNPNVLIELGYAIAQLGWERILLLFNSAFGKFPDDIPFDIDRHRASNFRVENGTDNSGIGNLAKLLQISIEKIIEIDPQLPIERRDLDKDQIKRNSDIKNLEWCLKYIHIPTIDYFLEEMPARIMMNIFYFELGFRSIIDSNSFHIYDEKLRNLIDKFKSDWAVSLQYGHQYDSVGSDRYYKFFMPMDSFQNDKAEKEYATLIKLGVSLRENFSNLITYIRVEYLEIDLKKTNEISWTEYLKETEPNL